MITVQHYDTETDDATTDPQNATTDPDNGPPVQELVLRPGPDRIFSVFSRVDLCKGRLYGPLPGLVKKFKPTPEAAWNDGRDHTSVKARIEVEMLRDHDWMQFFKVVGYKEANVHLLSMQGKIYLALTKDVSAEQELLMASYNKLVSSTLESAESRNEFQVVHFHELGHLIKRSDDVTEGTFENGVDDKTIEESIQVSSSPDEETDKSLKCDEGFEDIDSLHEHERSLHSPAANNLSGITYVCRRCFGKFTSDDDFSIHSKTCSAFTCIKCKLLFHRQKDFDFHMEKTHWQCPKCLLYFTSFAKLRHHSHFLTLICKTCRLQFSQKDDLFGHHINSAQCRNCADCGETLGTANDFFHHVRSHFPSPNYGNGPFIHLPDDNSDSEVPPFLNLSSFKFSCNPKQESSYDGGIPNMNLLPSPTQENLNTSSNSRQEISYEEIFSHNTSQHNSSGEIPFEEILSNRTLPASPTQEILPSPIVTLPATQENLHSPIVALPATQENLHSPIVTLPATQENLHSPTVPYNTSHPISSPDTSIKEINLDGTPPACPTQTNPLDLTAPQGTSNSNPILESSEGESNPNRTLPARKKKKNQCKYADKYAANSTVDSVHFEALMKSFMPLPANSNHGNLYSYPVPYGTLPYNSTQGSFPGQAVYYVSMPTMPNQSNPYDEHVLYGTLPPNSIQESFYGQSAPYGNLALYPNPANPHGPGVLYYALPYNYIGHGVYGQNVPYSTFPNNQQNLHNPNVPYMTLPYNPYQGSYCHNVPYGVMTATPNPTNLHGQNVPFPTSNPNQ